MKYQPTTIPNLFDVGMPRNTSGVLAATKRDGKWIETSVEEFKTKVRHFALGLHKLGISKGDKVAIHSENCTEWLIADLAVLSLGAADVPIYTTQNGEQVQYILENSEAKAYLFSKDELVDESWSFVTAAGNVEHHIAFLGSSKDGVQLFNDVLKAGEELDQKESTLFEQLKNDVEPDDLATLMYTSGTTGMPKGVMLAHNNMGSNVNASMERVPFEPTPKPGEKMLSYLPLSHVFERMVNYMYMKMGYPVYYIEDVNDIKEDFTEIQPKFFATVPRLLEKIYVGIKGKGQTMSGLQKQIYYLAVHMAEKYDPSNPPKGLGAVKHGLADKLVYSKIRDVFGGNLVGMISGGAALSPEIMKFVNALGIYCGQGYGLSETSPVIAVTEPGNLIPGSVGQPLTDVEVKIAGDGEILTKGPNVMKGYFKNEEKTKETFSEDGWLQTGDVGHVDEKGNLYVTDRKKSMFKLSTGKYVAPQPIENSLVNSPYVEQAVVIGFQRKFCSALIVPSEENLKNRLTKSGDWKEGERMSMNPKVRELIQKEIDEVNKNLSKWEQVKKFSILDEPLSVEAGELTPTLKLKRPTINKRFSGVIDDIYTSSDEGKGKELVS